MATTDVSASRIEKSAAACSNDASTVCANVAGTGVLRSSATCMNITPNWNGASSVASLPRRPPSEKRPPIALASSVASVVPARPSIAASRLRLIRLSVAFETLIS